MQVHGLIKCWELNYSINWSSVMNYLEWSSLKSGDKVKDFTFGKGVIISDVGIGYVVKFDSGKTVRISDGYLKKCQ